MRLPRPLAALVTALCLAGATFSGAAQPCAMTHEPAVPAMHDGHEGHEAGPGAHRPHHDPADPNDAAPGAPLHGDHTGDTSCPPLAPCSLHLADFGSPRLLGAAPAQVALMAQPAAAPPSHTVTPELPPPRA